MAKAPREKKTTRNKKIANIVSAALPPIPGAMVEDVPLPLGPVLATDAISTAGARIAKSLSKAGFEVLGVTGIELVTPVKRNQFPLPAAPAQIAPPVGVDAPTIRSHFVTPFQQLVIDYEAKRRELLRCMPELEQDEGLFNDTLDGVTELQDAIADMAMRIKTKREPRIAGLKMLRDEAIKSIAHEEHMLENEKTLMANTMQVRKISKITRPTISIRCQDGQQTAILIGEPEQLPSDYQTVKVTGNMALIKQSLKDGYSVTMRDAKGDEVLNSDGKPTPIAYLVNGKPFVVIKL